MGERGIAFALCLRGQRCRTSARSGTRLHERIASRGSGCYPEEEKRDFFAAIDCFALPSRCDSFGLVLLEAWANAKPNLVYRAGGPAEPVRPELDGLQAACGDVGELADAARAARRGRGACGTGSARRGRSASRPSSGGKTSWNSCASPFATRSLQPQDDEVHVAVGLQHGEHRAPSPRPPSEAPART